MQTTPSLKGFAQRCIPLPVSYSYKAKSVPVPCWRSNCFQKSLWFGFSTLPFQNLTWSANECPCLIGSVPMLQFVHRTWLVLGPAIKCPHGVIVALPPQCGQGSNVDWKHSSSRVMVFPTVNPRPRLSNRLDFLNFNDIFSCNLICIDR